MRIFKEEIFGPVLSVSTANNLDQALRYANGVEYGLTTSIFTENIDTIMNFVEEVETGMVHVNEPTIGGEAQLPFGGSKATGVGEREMAVEGSMVQGPSPKVTLEPLNFEQHAARRAI